MKNKIIGLLFTCVIIAMFLPTAYAANMIDSGTCGENLTWTLDNNGTLTISGTGKMESVYNGYNVLWYEHKDKIKNVVINNGAENIIDMAFYMCNGLRSITIPESVTTISAGAFFGCTGLSDINIPKSVNNIEPNAFGGCGSLNIYVDEKNQNYTDIDGILFTKDKTELLAYSKDKIQKTYTIPNHVTRIGDWAFSYVESFGKHGVPDLSNLMNVTIPSSITEIGNGSFSGCSNLREMEIPNSVNTVGYEAFSCCSRLESITLSLQMTEISRHMFSYCYNLKSIDIPQNITSIGASAFSGCKTLTEIVIPDSVVSIGDAAFSECADLEQITLPKKLTSISDGMFAFCSSMKSISLPEGITGIGEDAFHNCTEISSFKIPNEVTKINSWCFAGCENMTSIYIPNNVSEISGYSFINCDRLTDIYYAGNEEQWNKIHINRNYNDKFTTALVHYNAIGTAAPILTKLNVVTNTVGSNLKVALANTEYDSTMITVFYKDGQVVETEITPISAGIDTENITVPDGVAADTAKVFIWSSLESMKPLCNAKSIGL